MEQLYRELFERIQAYMAKYPLRKEQGLALHVPMIGSRYSPQQPIRLMWIGRAINGWDDLDFFDLPIDEYLEKIKALENCRSRFVWIKSYKNFRHSAFWRTCSLVHQRLYATRFSVEDWYEDIIWTNLYNVAPAIGGNPSIKLCKAQKTISAQLLQQQIRKYAPTHIVFVTDADWFSDVFPPDLLPEVVAIPNAKETDAVVAIGRIGNSKVVVTRRPEFRFSDEVFATSIIEAFHSIDQVVE